jgi:hypothetical protein
VLTNFLLTFGCGMNNCLLYSINCRFALAASCGNRFCDKRRDRRYCARCSHNGARAKRRALQHGRDPIPRLPAMILTFEGEIIADPSEDPSRDDPWLRQCANPECLKPFSAGRFDQQYCSRDCANNAVRAKRRAEHDITFIGIDGEGLSLKNEKGEIIAHSYVMMAACGIGTEPLVLHKNGKPLATEEILHWLYFTVRPAFPDACFVSYGMGYDLAQWIKDLPKSRAQYLFVKKKIAERKRRNTRNPTPFPVYWRPDRHSLREWDIDTLGDKRIKLRLVERPWRGVDASGEEIPPPAPRKPVSEEYVSKPKGPPWMYICDAFAFFQQAFLKAIDPKQRLTDEEYERFLEDGAHPKSLVTKQEFEIIKEGKARREDAAFDETMLKYCALECDVLARLMAKLNQGFVQNDIRLQRNKFFGPGQAAQAMLDLICKRDDVDFTRKNIEERVPFEFREAARRSYLGGWFELFKHGKHEGTAYEYDINSAYPKIIAQLPCLLHGQYLHGTGNPYRASQLRPHSKRGFGTAPGQILCLVDALVTGKHSRIGAMLHRQRNGSVVRPRMTEGWYWLHELEAAKRAGLIKTIDYSMWRAYIPCDCPKTLRLFEDMYQRRLDVGKNTSSGVALKLTYNSGYGKMAQSIGEPKYANAVYASLITAGCRCMILDAIATHPDGADAVLMIATDGIFFTAPHPDLPISNRLGEWEMKEHENLMLFKPGTYWDDDTRTRARNGEWGDIKFKSRGVNMEALGKVILELDDMFQPNDDWRWPSLPIKIPFQVISPQQALARNKWHLCGAVSNAHTIEISADPSSKRVANGPGWSAPHMTGDTLRSTPYNAAFGDETAASLLLASNYKQAMNIKLHPDGFLVHQLAEVFFGGKTDAGVI